MLQIKLRINKMEIKAIDADFEQEALKSDTSVLAGSLT